MDKNYVLALRGYGLKSKDFDKLSHDISTAKIIAAVYTARIGQFDGEEKQEQIEKAKQKQEEYQNLVDEYNTAYEECSRLLRIAYRAAPSSRTKQDISDTMQCLESKHLDNKPLCASVTNFLHTNLDNITTLVDEEEPCSI